MKHLLWVDLETTGLSPRADDIVEWAHILTTAEPPYEVLDSFESVVRPDDGWATRMVPRVVQMHSRSGLLGEIPNGISIETLDAAVVARIGQHGRVGEFTLAGSGVSHFDHEFIKVHMPGVAAFLRYATLDVGVIRRALGFAGREDLEAAGTTYEGDSHDDKPHRSMADITDHLAEWREYARLLHDLPVR